MTRLKRILKISIRSGLLISHILLGLMLALIFLRSRLHPDSFAARLTTWWHRRTGNIFGVKHQVHGNINQTPTLFIANHISWFDIPAIGCVIPLHFLAKDEIASWPVIGWFAQKTGTLFIHRGGKDASRKSIEAMKKVLQQGGHVLVFPEGTTSNGVTLGRFHSRLLQAAFDCGVPVQPVALTYPHADGIHPHAPYIGDVQLLDNALTFMASDDIGVSLHFLPPLHPQNFSGRDALTDAARQNIANIVENQPVAAGR